MIIAATSLLVMSVYVCVCAGMSHTPVFVSDVYL